MKKFAVLLSALMCLFISTSVLAQSRSVPAEAKKIGKYRQLFFLPQAKPINSTLYRIDTIVTVNIDNGYRIRVTVMGARGGDEFTVMVSEADSSRKTIMQQSFYMNGWKSEGVSVNTWFTDSETKIRKELDDFIYIYFGIKIMSHKDFLKSLRARAF